MAVIPVSRVSDYADYPIPWKEEPSLLSTWPDEGVICLSGKIRSAKCWQGLSKTNRAEAPQAKKLVFDAPYLVLSGKARDSREGFWAEGHPEGVEAPWDCVSAATPKLH